MILLCPGCSVRNNGQKIILSSDQIKGFFLERIKSDFCVFLKDKHFVEKCLLSQLNNRKESTHAVPILHINSTSFSETHNIVLTVKHHQSLLGLCTTTCYCIYHASLHFHIQAFLHIYPPKKCNSQDVFRDLTRNPVVAQLGEFFFSSTICCFVMYIV